MIFKSFPKPGTPYEMRNFLIATETIVVHDKVSLASYHRHGGPLSLKTVLGGEEMYNVHGFTEVVRKGEYLVVNGGQFYESSIESTAPAESLSIFFSLADTREARRLLLSDDALLDDPTAIGPAMEFSATKQSAPAALRERLAGVLSSKDAPQIEQSEAAIGLLYSLVDEQVTRLTEAGCMNSARPVARSELFRRCQVADAFMRAHFTDDISVTAIANTAQLSRAHFLRAFTRFFGETPAKRVQRLRLERAAAMLKAGECDVSAAALAVGYTNLSAFSRAFRVHFSVPPTVYAAGGSHFRSVQGGREA